MIKITSLNKTYFKNKKNENHVLRDINIDLPDKGLVVLLGKSGSGKTTLLNILSGLDRPDNGEIEILGKKIIGYNESEWNKIRNLHLGFIFQNYKIIEDITVYENIELVLKMNGIDPELIADRISYVLNAVGLKDYEKRTSSALSGGEQQRVSFARALVKNPDIIIADEPTGNLDSKNTVEAMDILEEIAKTKLVVMVTHDELLATCYADRIIKMSDGAVADDNPNTKLDKKILLEHLINYDNFEKEELSNESLNVNYYSDDLERTSVDIFKKNNTLYVKSDSKVRLAEDVYREAEQKTFEMTDFKRDSKKSFITVKHSIALAFKRLGKLSIYNKFLYFTLALVGIVASIATGLLGKVSIYDDSDIITKSRNYITVEIDNTQYGNVLNFAEGLDMGAINFVMDETKFRLETPKYYQITNFLEFYAHPSDISLLREDQIIYGIYPEKQNQIVIDEMLANNLIKMHNERGLDEYEDLIHSYISIQSSGSAYDIKADSFLRFEIVGISNDQSPTLWMSEELIYSILVPNVIDSNILPGVIVTSGVAPESHREVLINKQYTKHFGGVPKEVGTAVGSLEVTGVYEYFLDEELVDIRNVMLSEMKLVKQLYFGVNNIASAKSEFLIYSDTPEEDIVTLLENGIYAYSEYHEQFNDLVEQTNTENSGYYMFSVLSLAVSALSIYFIIRSSLLSRVYEISVYRALGSTKGDILRIFIVEIILISTLSSIIAFLATTGLLLASQQEVTEYISFVVYSPVSILLTVLMIYVTNIVFGIAPVLLILRKTPADLFAKYDI